MDVNSSVEKTIRISLVWVIVGFLAIASTGMAGGALMLYFFPPAQPLVPTSDRLLTTVQEVTISPNKAAGELVNNAQRSIVLLGSNESQTVEATGVVVTNDGVVVTPHTLLTSTPYAYDERGVAIPLQLIGRDEVFGLTYYRLSSGVFPAIDLRHDDPAIAHELLLLSRSKTTFQMLSKPWRVTEYALPSAERAPGIQRTMMGTLQNDPLLVGSPLLDDEGKIAGLVIDSSNSTGLTVQQLQDSITRVVGEKREFNPFKELGFSVRYTFINPTPTDPLVFAAQVTALTAGLPAGKAGLHTGDVITEIDGQPLQWNISPVAALSKTLPLTVTVLRDEQKQTITLSAVTP